MKKRKPQIAVETVSAYVEDKDSIAGWHREHKHLNNVVRESPRHAFCMMCRSQLDVYDDEQERGWFRRLCEWCHGSGFYLVDGQWVTCKCALPKESR